MKNSLATHQHGKGLSSSPLHDIQLCKLKKKIAYSDYIYRVLKEIPQDTCKFSWAVDVIRSLNKPHLYGNVALEATRMTHYKKKLLITGREVHVAVRMVLLLEAMKGNLLPTERLHKNLLKFCKPAFKF